MSYLPELRSSLVRAAERGRRINAPGRAAEPVFPDRRRRFQPPRFAFAMPTVMAIAVALAVAGIALIFGHGRAPTPPVTGPKPGVPKPSIPNPGPVPSTPYLQYRDQNLVDLAQRKTAAHDPACSPSSHGLPVVSQGSPSHELLSLLGVLRRPASAADAHARAVFTPSPGEIREIYMRYARPARAFHGASFFIVPAGDVTGFRAVPARCIAEQRATLQRILRHAGAGVRAQKVRLQAGYLAWERYGGAHPEGICLAAFGPMAGGGSRGLVDCTNTAAEIERGVANVEGALKFTYGVVPDGVATVSMLESPTNGRRFAPVTSTVVGNVWALVPAPGNITLSTWIWRDAAGRIVKTVRWPPG